MIRGVVGEVTSYRGEGLALSLLWFLWAACFFEKKFNCISWDGKFSFLLFFPSFQSACDKLRKETLDGKLLFHPKLGLQTTNRPPMESCPKYFTKPPLSCPPHKRPPSNYYIFFISL
jgi:hypothetical protein